jgi:hypothetical protein
MKIGIVGLFPKQVADLKGRNLGIEMDFFDEKKSYSAEHVETFARHVDRLIIMMPKVPKQAWSRVPASKVYRMTGSVSTIIRYFETFKIAQELEQKEATPAVVKQTLENIKNTVECFSDLGKVIDTKSLVVSTPVGSENAPAIAKVLEVPVKLAMVPSGMGEGRYQWSESTVMIPTKENGGHSYQILDEAKVGDVLRFARPADINLLVWKQRITTIRANRLKVNKQTIVAHFYETYVDLSIEEIGCAMTLPSGREVTLRAPKESELAVLPGNAERTENFASEHLSTSTERVFWRRVYLASMSHSGNHDQALKDADSALKAHRIRFPAAV